MACFGCWGWEEIFEAYGPPEARFMEIGEREREFLESRWWKTKEKVWGWRELVRFWVFLDFWKRIWEVFSTAQNLPVSLAEGSLESRLAIIFGFGPCRFPSFGGQEEEEEEYAGLSFLDLGSFRHDALCRSTPCTRPFSNGYASQKEAKEASLDLDIGEGKGRVVWV
ncbi:hypothetical protein FRC15_009288 [Serendipita sp. 397]|nr:hypothetical protein FRC15_009288 [Serendipita sp. 397]